MYESPNAQVYWDGPVYADHTCVKANRVDAPLVDHKRNEVWGGGESRKADEKKIAVCIPHKFMIVFLNSLDNICLII